MADKEDTNPPNQYDGVFGGLPERAMRDPAFNGLTRVFIAIARRDGRGKGGQGCFASNNQLAEDTGLDPSTVSTHRNTLARRLYITRERSPRRGNMWVHRVIYNEEGFPIEKGSRYEKGLEIPKGKVPRSVKKSGNNLSPRKSEVVENIKESGKKRTYIEENLEENLYEDAKSENPVLEGGVLNAQQGEHTEISSPLPATLKNFSTGVVLWNDMVEKTNRETGTEFKPVQIFTSQRKAKLDQRLKECGGIEGWKVALEKVSTSPWLRGDKGDWMADFGWVIEKRNFIKIMEGKYDPRNNKTGTQTASDKLREGIANAVMDRALAS